MIIHCANAAVQWLDHPWPCTIIATRYGGAYEGAAWAAFADEEVPEEAVGGDSGAEHFWRTSKQAELVGRGASPDEAYEDLKARLRAFSRGEAS